jgi:hypothetical protein
MQANAARRTMQKPARMKELLISERGWVLQASSNQPLGGPMKKKLVELVFLAVLATSIGS